MGGVIIAVKNNLIIFAKANIEKLNRLLNFFLQNRQKKTQIISHSGNCTDTLQSINYYNILYNSHKRIF